MPIERLSWEQFKLNNENCQADFEDMCRSLFRKKYCKGEILHSNPNNPGIETNPFYDSAKKNYIGFQAKFFENHVDYTDIADSLHKAIQYYNGQIDVIYIFCNKAIDDSCKSFIDIKEELNANKVDVKLITGNDLLDLIEEYSSVQAKYFRKIKLTSVWFNERLETAIADFGARYNQEFNIETDVQKKLNVFSKNFYGCQYINNFKNKVIESLSDSRIRYSDYASLAEQIARYIQDLKDIDGQTINQSQYWFNNLVEKFSNELNPLNEFYKDFWNLHDNNTDNKEKEKLRDRYNVIRDIFDALELIHFSDEDNKLIENQILFLTGQIGTGKTQAIVNLIKQNNDTGVPSVIIPAQTLTTDFAIDKQILEYLHIEGSLNFDEFISVLDEVGFESNNCIILGIDAINETSFSRIWQQGLNGFISQFKKHRNVKLIISVKSDYMEYLLPEDAMKRIELSEYSELECKGFSDDSLHDVNLFLYKKGITEYPSAYFQRELTNPFLLTLFCDVFSGKDIPTIKLFDEFTNKANEKLHEQINKPIPSVFTRNFVKCLIQIKESSLISYVPTDDLYDLGIWEHYGLTDYKVDIIDFYYHFGLIDKFIDREGNERCYFGFNALSNFYTAQYYVNQKDSAEETKQIIFERFITDKEIYSQDDIESFGIACQLFADRYKEECIYILDQAHPLSKYRAIREYYKSLSWRDNLPSIDEYIAIANKYRVDKTDFWPVFFECSIREKCNLNAEGLTEYLKKLPIAKRDTLWTTYVNDLCEEEHILSLIEYINSGENFDFSSNNAKFLFVEFLCWMLTSSNRIIRDHVSRALVKLLQNSFEMCLPLLKLFYDVDDPYIIQRLFGIVFGVCTREQISKNQFAELACWVYNTVFCKKEVYPDILLRDYARLTIEYYTYLFPEEQRNIDITRISPPFHSAPIPLTERFVDNTETASGYSRIVSSMIPDTKEFRGGFYGDFGRYVFQSRLEEFDGFDITNAYNYALHFIFEDLKYSNSLSDYDKEQYRYSFSRMDNMKKERIGKKYQWIAFYNIAARASDQYRKLKTYSDEPETYYKGTWNPFFRDFDPTTEPKLGYYKLQYIPSFNDIQEYFIPNISDKETGNKWVKQNCPLFQSVQDKIRIKIDGKVWIALYNSFYYSLPGNNPLDHYSEGHQILLFISHAMVYPKKSKFTMEDINYVGFNLQQDYAHFGRELLFDKTSVNENDTIEELESSCMEYLWEAEYDASKEEAFTILMPSMDMIKKMGLKKKAFENCFYCEDEMVLFSLNENRNKSLLIREDYLCNYLKNNKLDIIWDLYGEKQFNFSAMSASSTRWESFVNMKQLKDTNCGLELFESYIN